MGKPKQIDWGSILHQVEQRGIGGADELKTWWAFAASLQAAHEEEFDEGDSSGDSVQWQIFHAISLNSANYKSERDCRRTWRSFRNPKAYTPGLIIKHLKDNGVTITLTDGSSGSMGGAAVRNSAVRCTENAVSNAVYYIEAANVYDATTSAQALRRSPLRNYLRRLLWGHDAYWRIADVWQAYGAGYDEPHELFRYYDTKGGLCKIKYCAYHKHDGEKAGHRIQPDEAAFYTMFIKQPEHAVACFFGEHLLPNDGGKPVGIVEAEKTALIMACIVPGVTWIATGGKGNLDTLRHCSALSGRDVLLYPDIDAVDEWTEIAHGQGWATAAERIPWYVHDLQAIGEKSDIADKVSLDYANTNALPSMAAARSMAKRHPALWRLMSEFQCSVII